MFEQLRVKVAIRQSLTLGFMLILLLGVIFSYNLTRISSTIDKTLAEIRDNRDYNFWGSETASGNKLEPPRDTFAIFVDKKSNEYLPSNMGFYDTMTLSTLINAVMKGNAASGRYIISGNHIAFATSDTLLGKYIYIYDYTKDYDNLRNSMVIIIVSGCLGMIAITLFSFLSAKKHVAPIENTFFKQQDLIANASHELKTPLTIINANLSILNSGRDGMTDEQAKWLDSIGTQVSRMSDLITEMLELARVEAGRDKQEKENVSVSDITEGVVLNAEVLAFEHNITFRSRIQPNVCIPGVRAQIEKLVYILVENALKYTNNGGTVDIEVEAERKRATFKIRNTGEGIPRDKIPNLFDRFYRTDEAHTANNSFGLGLAIAKSIVDAHEGTIGVDSKEGEYTEFVVLLKQ